jgi:glycerophosphoryl diester phosphodiesterase
VLAVSIAIAAGAAAFANAGVAGAAETDWPALRTINIAHQGGENEAPSNTMYANKRALGLGADMLELDIHTTADGELVVLHDATVNRTTNGSGRVYDMTLEEVQALDAGYNLVPGEGTERGRPESEYPFRGVRTGERRPPPGFVPRDFRIPTLGEVMSAYPLVPINIEIKGATDTDVASFMRNAEALAAFLNELGRTRGVIVVSFNDAALDRFHQLAPQIDLAASTGEVAAYKAGIPPPQGTVAFQVPIEFGGVTVTDEAFVQQAHGDGYAVHVWTINDEPTMNQLLDWQVEGIMTAEPMRLERVLCRRGTDRPPQPLAGPGLTHCSKRASIACDPEPVRAERRGGSVRVVLRRRDEFAGRCAGRLRLEAFGSGARESARFNFGRRPPSKGGPSRRVVRVELSDGLRLAAERGRKVLVEARPYGAFVERDRLRLR